MRAFDGHNDVLSRLHQAGAGNEAFLEGGGDGHLDVPRARAGGLAGGLFAVFPCSPFRGEENPFTVDYARPLGRAEALVDPLAMVRRLAAIERESEGAVRIVRDADALDACLDDGSLAAVLQSRAPSRSGLSWRISGACIDAVALGSDFDGATMPHELDSAAKLPALFDALREFGFAEQELTRIALGNWRRVLRDTWGTE